MCLCTSILKLRKKLCLNMIIENVLNSKNNVVNQLTHLKGQTRKGQQHVRVFINKKLAVVFLKYQWKRVSERMVLEVKFTMNRLTNSFSTFAGLNVLIFRWGVHDYVVLCTQKCMKQLVTFSLLKVGSSTVNIKHKKFELRIALSTTVGGQRRNWSTIIINRKSSSLARLATCSFSGSYKDQQLLKLQDDLAKGLKAKNLSILMSDPNFLIFSWLRRQSYKHSLMQLSEGFLYRVEKSCFIEAAEEIKKRVYCFQPARKTDKFKSDNNNQYFLTVQILKDQIVQEGMRFLLEIIFEPLFTDSSYCWRPEKACLKALDDIRRKCKESIWYIEGEIGLRFFTSNHKVLISIIKTKVNDPIFIELVQKYLSVRREENLEKLTYTKIGLIQGGILSSILANIYMYPFDKWVDKHLKFRFNKGKQTKEKICDDKLKSKNKRLRPIEMENSNFRRLHYFRYADTFLMGVEGSKEDCLKLKNEINFFLQNTLNLMLEPEKTKIKHPTKASVQFLGYKIFKPKLIKMLTKKNKLRCLSQVAQKLVLDAPIKAIITKLIERKYVTKRNNPTRNGRFINYQLPVIINHYRAVERALLNFYSLSNNYRKFATKIHYILKYSCILTVASKMKLKTKKQVFKKYGKNLKIVNGNGQIITYYPEISYKQSRI